MLTCILCMKEFNLTLEEVNQKLLDIDINNQTISDIMFDVKGINETLKSNTNVIETVKEDLCKGPSI